VTDQTKKRKDGKKRINRAAVKAPTGSVDEEKKEGDENAFGYNLSRI